jgi:protein PsiE
MISFSAATQAIVKVAEKVGLGLIFAATLVSMWMTVWHMVEALKVELGDLLLLFLFMEVISMIAIFNESHRVPVRFPIYIAIVALARYLILDIKGMDLWTMVTIGGTILLLAVAVLVIRYGHLKFPYGERDC